MKISLKKGITLVELLIVISILGVMLTIGYSFLSNALGFTSNNKSPASFESLFSFIRAKALQEEELFSFYIDKKENHFGVIRFNPILEHSNNHHDTNFIWQKRIRDQKEENSNSQNSTQINWISGPFPLPSNLKSILALNGWEISSKRVFLHFYQDGSNDGAIFEFEDGKKLVLPRGNLPTYLIKNEDNFY